MTTDQESARRGRIVLGTFALEDNEVAPALLDRYYAAGGRALDLANVYLDGEAVAGGGQRGCGSAGWPATWCCTPRAAIRRPATRTWCARRWSHALRLTGLEYLDVFLLHRDNTEVPVQAWVDALGRGGRGGPDRRLRGLQLAARPDP